MTEPLGTSSTPSARPYEPGAGLGRLVAGRYRLGAILGVGGMAIVHRAEDTRLHRLVAIKLLRLEVAEDTDIAMRFRREALAATVLRHPNIVACLEAGTDDGQPFLVMELVEGEDLAARLRRVGRLAPAEVVRIGLDVARGLGAAHARGIIHRDMKPGNILLARDGRAIITDFGIARLAADPEAAVPGTTLGSVHYFSPEQAKGEGTTAASDVYGLGLVLYEALTGERAWSADTTAALAAVRVGAPAPSPRAKRPEVPAALDSIVVRALDPDASHRYANGTEIAAALAPLVGPPNPLSPTEAHDNAAMAASAGASTTPASGPRPPSEPTFPPEPPSGAASGPSGGHGRRPPASVAGPLFVLVCVVAVVAGALWIVARPRAADSSDASLASPSPAATVRPTPRPTARPTPKATAKPTAKPTPTPRAAGRNGADLCDPIFGLPCGLDAGTYEPARFEPPLRLALGKGWSTVSQDPHLMVLGRDTGKLTFASAIDAVYESGAATAPPSSARNLVEAFITTDGVASSKTSKRKIDKHSAVVVDLWPSGSGRIALFGTAGQTFYLESSAPTRFTVIDTDSGPLVIAAEPGDGSSLEGLWPEAKRVVEGVRFR